MLQIAKNGAKLFQQGDSLPIEGVFFQEQFEAETDISQFASGDVRHSVGQFTFQSIKTIVKVFGHIAFPKRDKRLKHEFDIALREMEIGH